MRSNGAAWAVALVWPALSWAAPPAAAPAAAPAASVSPIDVPEASATIRMLLDLQSRPGALRPAEAEAPRAPLVPEPAPERTTEIEPAPAGLLHEETGPARDEATEPVPAAAASPREDFAAPRSPASTASAQPPDSVLRRAVAYLREHRQTVLLIGVLALSSVAIASAISARRRAGRGRTTVTAARSSRSGSGRRRRPHAHRS